MFILINILRYKPLYFCEKKLIFKPSYVPLNSILYIWKNFKNQNKNYIFIEKIEVSVIKICNLLLFYIIFIFIFPQV